MRTATFFEDLRVGQSASLGKTISEADIPMYAAVSLDTNPIHLDAEAARQSVFGERIAHGMLSAGLTALHPEKKRVTLKTTCSVGDGVVIEGEAYVQVPSRG